MPWNPHMHECSSLFAHLLNEMLWIALLTFLVLIAIDKILNCKYGMKPCG